MVASAVNWSGGNPLGTAVLVDIPYGENAQVVLTATVDGVVVASRSYTITTG